MLINHFKVNMTLCKTSYIKMDKYFNNFYLWRKRLYFSLAKVHKIRWSLRNCMLNGLLL